MDVIVEMGIPDIRRASIRVSAVFVRVSPIDLCAVRVPIGMRAIRMTLAVGVTIAVTGGLQSNNIS